MARVPYTGDEDLDPNYRDLIVSSLQPGKRVNVYSAIGNNQEVLAGFREFLGALWSESGLTDRQRELLILTVASEIGSTYEWHQYVNIATDAGVSKPEISAIVHDDQSPFSEEEHALVAYGQAVIRGRATDAHYETLTEYFDDEAVVGAATTAAGYLALGRVIDALSVEIESGDKFVGWEVK